MQSDVNKVFYFHADANALGGYVETPEAVIPSQASASLHTSGGSDIDHGTDFKHENIVSCRSSYTHVAGIAAKRNGPWHSRVTSVVEHLDILGLLTAERVVSRVYVEHPEDGSPARISLAGSHFHNLRLNGKKLDLAFDNALMPQPRPSDDAEYTGIYNQQAILKTEIDWSALWNTARKQSQALRGMKDVPAWIVERYEAASIHGPEKAGYAICSLVEMIGTVDTGKTYGHILEIENVGRFFFGEALVSPSSIQLTMVRAELGCDTNAQVGVATARSNGTRWPPG